MNKIYTVPLEEMPLLVQEFAAYKSGIQNCSSKTVSEYLMDLRIRKSLRLLESDGLSVTDAALASGFSSSSYYTEVFRRYMGCTPREYLQRKKR